MTFTVAFERGDASGDPMGVALVFLVRGIKHFRQVTCKWHVRNLECETWSQRRDEKPTPTVLRLGPFLVRIEDRLGDVITKLPQMMSERLTCQCSAIRRDVFNDTRQG